MPFLIAIPVVVLLGALAWRAHHAKAAAAASTAPTAPGGSPPAAGAPGGGGAGFGLLGSSLFSPGQVASAATLPANMPHLIPITEAPPVAAAFPHLIPIKAAPQPSSSDQIHAAASAALAALPATFSNDPYTLNRQIAVAALQYLIANPTAANLVATIQQLAKNGSPEGQAAGVALQQTPGMNRYMTG
jgi:hypothetical protein